jgi:hypothetical protein
VCPRFHALAAVSFCSRAALPAAERGIPGGFASRSGGSRLVRCEQTTKASAAARPPTPKIPGSNRRPRETVASQLLLCDFLQTKSSIRSACFRDLRETRAWFRVSDIPSRLSRIGPNHASRLGRWPR